MIFARRQPVRLETERMVLRLPQHSDFNGWVALRIESREFLTRWEPAWSPDHLTRKAFTNRVYWSARAARSKTALPFLMERAVDGVLLGAITLDNIRRGPAQMASIGYWIGARHARQGYMAEAIRAVTRHAFRELELSRIEAACLPENTASRALLTHCGFAEEGFARAYLQINGDWRDHVQYAMLHPDRQGKAQITCPPSS